MNVDFPFPESDFTKKLLPGSNRSIESQTMDLSRFCDFKGRGTVCLNSIFNI